MSIPRMSIPQTAFHYRVLPLGISLVSAEHFSSAIQKVDFDFSQKTMNLEVVQHATKESFDAIMEVSNFCKFMVVDLLSGSGNVNFSIKLGIDDIDHQTSLDYSVNASMIHKLSVNFSRMETLPGTSSEVELPVVIDTPVDEFLTPKEAIDLVDQSNIEAKTKKRVKKSDVEE